MNDRNHALARIVHKGLLLGVALEVGATVSTAHAAPIPAPAGLVAWWTGDNNGNDIVGGYDAIPRGNAGTAPGLVKGAFTFDGSGDYFVVPDSPAFQPGTGSFTYDMWIQTTQTVSAGNVVELLTKREGCGSRSAVILHMLPGGIIRAAILSGAVPLIAFNGVIPVNNGAWNHVALVRDMTTNTLSLYVNGVPDGSGTTPGVVVLPQSTLVLGSGPCAIGGAAITPFFKGMLDEVQYFNRALTAAEVNGIVAAGSSGQVKPKTKPVTAAELVSYRASGYTYKIVPKNTVLGFEKTCGSDPAFLTGSAAFGMVGPPACSLNTASEIQTIWTPGATDLLLRRNFTLPLDAEHVRVFGAVDDTMEVFLNGQSISGGMKGGFGCAYRDSLGFVAPDSALVCGVNCLAVRANDTGTTNFLDVELVADLPNVRVHPPRVPRCASSAVSR